MFSERQSLDDVAKLGGIKFGWLGEVPGVKWALGHKMTQYRCPSDSLGFDASTKTKYLGAIQPVWYRNHDALAWIEISSFASMIPAITNYAGCFGAHSGGVNPREGYSQYIGMMSSRAPIRAHHVTDGLTGTIFFGEQLGYVTEGQRQAAQVWFVGGVGRGRADADWLHTPVNEELLGTAWEASAVGFASAHPSGVLFAYGDGRVDVANRSIQWQAFYSLCGIADGNYDGK